MPAREERAFAPIFLFGGGLYDVGEKKPVPPYSVIVYKDNDKIRAEDAKGKRISWGRSPKDDKSVIQDAINSLPDDGGKIVLREGTYYVESPIELRSDIVFENQGVIKASSKDVMLVKGYNIKNFELRGGKYDGARSTYGGEQTSKFGLSFENCENFRIVGIYVYDTTSSGLFIQYSNDFIVTQSRFELTGQPNVGYGDGIKVISSEKFTISDCIAYQTGHCCFDIATSYRFTLTGNVATYSRSRNGFTINTCKWGVLVGNVAYQNAHDGVRLENSRRIIVASNSISYNGRCGIKLYTIWDSADCVENVVYGNFISDNNKEGGTDYDGIRLGEELDSKKTGYNLVVGNYIIRGSGERHKYGIRLRSDAQHNQIFRNHVVWGGELAPILDEGSNNVVRENIGFLTENSGVATFSGDGSAKQFSIAHGLVSEPSKVQVTPMTEDAAGDFYVTKDSTNIYVNYLSAPPSGSDNVKLSWYAEV